MPDHDLIPHGDCVDTGDTAWVLISAVLVGGMLPGLGFFESGMLPRKNALSVLIQIFMTLSIIEILWLSFTFSLTFGPDHGGVIGDFSYAFFHDLANHCLSPFAPNIPAIAFAMFELMFAAIAPLLITGTVAGRMRLPYWLLFAVWWHLTVYVPVAHSMWGGGFLQQLGAQDFAGGIVLHATAGASSLIMALSLGKRIDWDEHHGEAPPHNLTLASIGAALLFLGWFCFNGGSAFAASTVAATATSSTIVGASVACLVFVLLSIIHAEGKKTIGVAVILNGMLAGLAGITPASGFISSSMSLPVAVLIGMGSFYGMHGLKKLEVDDVLDVSSVHGISGIIGSLAIGVFGEEKINAKGQNGLIRGHWSLLGAQFLAVVVSVLWSMLMTGIFAAVVARVVSCSPRHYRRHLRVSTEKEKLGLDYIYGHGDAYEQLGPDPAPGLHNNHQQHHEVAWLDEEATSSEEEHTIQ